MVQDLFKPALLLAIGALAYFIRSQLGDIKDTLTKLTEKVDKAPDKYVEKVDCAQHVGECRERIKERRVECNHSMDALKEVTSSLVQCVNKWVDNCEVKTK